MKNWKYINGAEGVKIGNTAIPLTYDIAKQIREMAGKYWHSGIHDSRTLAMTVTWELAKKYDFIRDTKDDFVSKVKEVIDDYLKQTKVKNDTPEELEKDVEKKDKEKAEDVEELKKTGNALGKDIYQHKLDPNQYMVVDWDKDTVTIIVNGAVRDVIKNTDKVAYAVDHVYKRVNSMNKVGNSKWEYPDGTIAEVDEDGTIYYTKKDGTILKNKVWDKERAESILLRKGCKKVGNVASEYEILKQDPSKMHPMYKKAYEEAMKKLAQEDEEFKKRFEKEYGVKAKNEASDDKFAYVMREFEEGKLKTPDGKVVTDPAQAKAIAYSESKKTENGLARARNAIKK